MGQWVAMNPALRSVASGAVKLAAAGADALGRPGAGVTVLIYHRVGGRSGTPVDLPTSLFVEQMSALADMGAVTTLAVAIRDLHRQPDVRDKRVVVTFDDGTADFADEALPVLVDRRIPVTLYLATAFVDEGRPFPDAGTPISWAGLRDALSTGLVTVGSHTHTHLLLDRAPAGQAEQELDTSIGLIGDRLGAAAEDFAYPKAVAGSPAAERLVRTRFRSAALAGTRLNRYGQTDLHRLARSPIQVADGMRWFRRKVDGGMALEDTLRRWANRRRYAGAVS